MTSYIIAQGILMALWLALWQSALLLIQRYKKLQGPQYLTALLLWSGLAWGVLAWLSWRYLPSSVMSAGWSMENIASARLGSMLLTAAMALFLIVYKRKNWMPESELASLKAAVRKTKPSMSKEVVRQRAAGTVKKGQINNEPIKKRPISKGSPAKGLPMKGSINKDS